MYNKGIRRDILVQAFSQIDFQDDKNPSITLLTFLEMKVFIKANQYFFTDLKIQALDANSDNPYFKEHNELFQKTVKQNHPDFIEFLIEDDKIIKIIPKEVKLFDEPERHLSTLSPVYDYIYFIQRFRSDIVKKNKEIKPKNNNNDTILNEFRKINKNI